MEAEEPMPESSGADQSWRAQPPFPRDPREWHFPRIHRKTLGNGLRLLVAPATHTPLVSVRVLVRSGADSEPLERAGLASLTASLLDEGAGGRDAMTIAEDTARLGAFLGTGADWDASYAVLDVLGKNLERGFALLHDVIRSPHFDQEELDRLRDERLTTMIQQRDDPSSIAARRFSGLVYGTVRYGTPMIGTEETVQAITRDDVDRFYRSVWTPANLSLIITGDVIVEDAVALVESRLGDWSGTTDPTVAPPSVERAAGTTVFVVDRPGSVQSEIRIGHVGVERTSEDYFPIVVMNSLLGEIFNSRIMINLRERHGYTYGARSSFVFRRHAGPFVVSTAVRNEVTTEAVREVFHELDRIRNEDVSEEELTHAQDYLMGIFPATVQTANDLASRIQEMELYGLPDDYFDHYRENIGRVTRHDVARVARAYISPGQATVVIVGEASEVRERLGELGHRTEILDIDGRPMEER
jgi:zinc protease